MRLAVFSRAAYSFGLLPFPEQKTSKVPLERRRVEEMTTAAAAAVPAAGDDAAIEEVPDTD